MFESNWSAGRASLPATPDGARSPGRKSASVRLVKALRRRAKAKLRLLVSGLPRPFRLPPRRPLAAPGHAGGRAGAGGLIEVVSEARFLPLVTGGQPAPEPFENWADKRLR